MTTEEEIHSLFPEDEISQEVVLARAKAYLDARRAKEAAEVDLSNLTKSLTEAEAALILAMDGADVKGLKIEHRGEVAALSQMRSVYFSLPPGGISDANVLAWITDNGGKDIMKPAIHHATFSSFCKELVDQGKVIPPMIKVAERRGIQLRKG